MNKDIIEKIKSTNSSNELKELANKGGYPLTDEEAKKYFELFHNNGKVNEQELLNISGGKCEDPSKWCRGMSRYSSDEPHYLITTLINDGCNLFTPDKYYEDRKSRNCYNCGHRHSKGAVQYCHRRKFYDDPENP